MKRMRYLAGAIALAPVAGMTLPATAYAGDTQAASHANTSKKVSLAHSGMAARPDSACNGNQTFDIPKLKLVAGHGWYRHNGTLYCVGHVNVTLDYTHVNCKVAYLWMDGDSNNKYSRYMCGSPNNPQVATFDVSTSFSLGFSACDSSTYATSFECQTVGITSAKPRQVPKDHHAAIHRG